MKLNPYRFEPIRKEKIFACRDNELKKVRTYLNYSISKPINLEEERSFFNFIISGPRGSGKTSLLNIIKSVSEKNNSLAVSIDLRVTDQNNNISFFKTIFDSIMADGVSKNMYGGKSGRFYKQFRDILDNLSSNVEINLPFYFIKIYLAKREGRNPEISLHELKNDSMELTREAIKNSISSIVLIFDDCENLAKNKDLINSMRSIFDYGLGYQCIFSGNENIINIFSEFVPLIIIRLKDFITEDEIKEFLLYPLNDKEKKIVDEQVYKKILKFSDGSASPRILNLFGHYMYKEYQESGNNSISISYDVLCNVLEQLEILVIDQEKRSEMSELIDTYMKFYSELGRDNE